MHLWNVSGALNCVKSRWQSAVIPEARHGIVLTANYVAKPRGVKTGMAIWQAKQVCPELVVLPADMGEYIRFSKMAREYLRKIHRPDRAVWPR